MVSPTRPEDLDALEHRIDAWLAAQLEENPIVAAVDRDETPGERRWFVRVRGEQKDTFTVWLQLQQRTLHYETYVMPAPEENHAQFFEHLLRRNPGSTAPPSRSARRTPSSSWARWTTPP